MTSARSEPGPAFPRRRGLVLVGLVLVVLWLARSIIGPFVVAAALAYAFSPIVDAMAERTRWPRGAVVSVAYVGVLLALGLIFLAVAGRITSELGQLARAGPDAVSLALRQLLGQDTITIGSTTVSVHELASQLQSALVSSIETPGGALHLASQAAEVALNAVLAAIVTFYLLLDGRRFRDTALRFLPPADRERALVIGARIHLVLGRWLRGQLLLVALVAVVVYLVLGPILHVPYSSALGVLTGVLEVIPLVGPLIAASIAGLVAYSAGGAGLAGTVLVVYLVLRQVEDQVVMPVVIGRAVHLHPVVTIFAVLVGLSTFGVLGGLLAVPVAAAANVTLREFYPAELPPLEAETAVARPFSSPAAQGSADPMGPAAVEAGSSDRRPPSSDAGRA